MQKVQKMTMVDRELAKIREILKVDEKSIREAKKKRKMEYEKYLIERWKFL